MQRELAIIVRDLIKDLPFVGIASGLVKTIERSQNFIRDEKNIIEITRFPATLDVTEPLVSNDYFSMVPDQKYKSMFYVESGITTPVEKTNRGTKYTSNMRLVGWMNKDKITETETEIIVKLLKALPEHPANTDIFNTLSLQPGTIRGIEEGLFDRYTYSESVRQYLMAPYTAIGLNLDISYYINPSCFI